MNETMFTCFRASVVGAIVITVLALFVSATSDSKFCVDQEVMVVRGPFRNRTGKVVRGFSLFPFGWHYIVKTDVGIDSFVERDLKQKLQQD